MTQEMSVERMRELVGVVAEPIAETTQQDDVTQGVEERLNLEQEIEAEQEQVDEQGDSVDTDYAGEGQQDDSGGKKKHFIPKARLDEVSAKAREAERRADLLEQKYNELVKLVEQRFTGDGEQQSDNESDVDLDSLLESAVDSDAYKALSSKMKNIESELTKYKQRTAETAFSTALDKADKLGASSFTDYDAAVKHLVNVRTQQVFMAAKAVGHDYTPEQARAAAVETFARELQSIYQGTQNPATLAQYTYYQAAASGFEPNKKFATQKKQGTSGVDMAAVDNLRRTAGAPSYDKVDSPAKPLKSMKQTIADEYMKRNPDADISYLKKLGLA